MCVEKLHICSSFLMLIRWNSRARCFCPWSCMPMGPGCPKTGATTSSRLLWPLETSHVRSWTKIKPKRWCFMIFTSWFIVIFHYSGYLLHAGAWCAEVPPPKEAHQRVQARVVSPNAFWRPASSPPSSEAGGVLGDVEGQVFFILLQVFFKIFQLILQCASHVAPDERCSCPWFLHLSMTTRKGSWLQICSTARKQRRRAGSASKQMKHLQYMINFVHISSWKHFSCPGCHFNNPERGLMSRMRTTEGTQAAREEALGEKRGRVARLKAISSESTFFFLKIWWNIELFHVLSI